LSESTVALRQGWRTLGSEEANPPEHDEFALDVLRGLTSSPMRIPSRWLYDARGSELFVEITTTEEYYPTRVETSILETYASHIAETFLWHRHLFRVIELGAGDGTKIATLLRAFLSVGLHFDFVPIDCSPKALDACVDHFSSESAFQNLSIHGLCTDYFRALTWLNSDDHTQPNLVLFLGSNIGNLTSEEMRSFLTSLWFSLNHGDLILIGFDLVKDSNVLECAYNDISGVTRAFNLNLLQRINRELHADFPVTDFYHHAFWNPRREQMESWLIADRDCCVKIPPIHREFSIPCNAGILVEVSRKFRPSGVSCLADEIGFRVEEQFFDLEQQFLDVLWCVQKRSF